MGYDVIIIGGGASGLMAAAVAGRRGRFALVLDQKERPGKKIYATGNGKCNFTNRVQTPDCYRGGGGKLAFELLSHFGWEQAVDFFAELGIVPKERNGYFYPNSEQAASIAEVLRLEVLRTGGCIRCLERVSSLKKEKNEFLVETVRQQAKEEGRGKKKKERYPVPESGEEGQRRFYRAPKIILAAGGMAAPSLGSDGSGFALAAALGHTILRPLPALTQFVSPEAYLKTLAGVRVCGRGTMQVNSKPAAWEEGEFLFTDYGISGIPVLQMSRFAAEAMADGLPVRLQIDFFPKLSENKLYECLKARYAGLGGKNLKTAEEALIGMVHSKLGYILLKECGIPPETPASEIAEEALKGVSQRMKGLTLKITGTKGFDQAQVTAGGVEISEVKEKTLESTIVEGLYFAGEILDVDGTCGGYNLQWAWTSGAVAGAAI